MIGPELEQNDADDHECDRDVHATGLVLLGVLVLELMRVDLRFGVELVVAAIALAQAQEHRVAHKGGKHDEQNDAFEGGERTAGV